MSRMAQAALGTLASVALLASAAAAGEGTLHALVYAPAPVNNPLKGLVPFAGNARDQFPHSMEFSYVPFSALVTGFDQYDWEPMEGLLNAVASRGHQTIFRVFLEYPGRAGSLPSFLINGGLIVHKHLTPQESETPDYNDANLRKAMTQFIAALGKKYDGDPRIGFITAGLLGSWGEWHDHPRSDLFASKAVQTEVMDAYEAAFKVTPVLLRYPAAEPHAQKAPNAKRRFGYHDDSFAWATLDTGEKGNDWHFMALVKAAGPEALDKWKTQPIGGEIRPEAWGRVFDVAPGLKEIQNFRACVEATHVSWLMDSGMFKEEKEQNPERIRRAGEDVRRMGYEFHVPAVTIGPVIDGTLAVKVEVENRGVAPFYYDWPVEFGLLDADGNVAKKFKGAGKLIGLLPGEKPRAWDEKLALQGVKAGAYRLAVRVPNPLPKGMPLRFANDTQDRHAVSWLTLAPVPIKDLPKQLGMNE